MLKKTVNALEVICVIGAVLIAIIWVRDPAGGYEPALALSTVVAVVLDLLRRTLRSSKLRVFLSVGSTYTNAQEEYVKSFERFLVENDCERLVVGRGCPASRQPILQIRDLMGRADAVVVLAFTRYVIVSGIEKQGADRPKHKAADIKDAKYPTVWNQIEAAIAFGLKRPLLFIVEEGLQQEAMLKDRHEFKTIVSAMDPEMFESEDFRNMFADFARIARRRSWLRW